MLLLSAIACLPCASMAQAQQAAAEYGKIFIKSAVPNAKVYVDGVLKGPANKTIEKVPVGEHAISCRTEAQSISGTYVIGDVYIHKWEARFDTARFVSVADMELLIPEPGLPASLPAATAALKPVKVKKPAEAAPKKSPAEERRLRHMTLAKVFFEDVDAQDVLISHKENPFSVSRYKEDKKQLGAYFRTKKDILLCEAGPCEQQWSTSFQYTDETGKIDAFSLIWKRTVFSGMTPEGTSKRELVCCLNGVCQTLRLSAISDGQVNADIGRYQLRWTRSLIVIRRSDLIQEVRNEGGSFERY